MACACSLVLMMVYVLIGSDVNLRMLIGQESLAAWCPVDRVRDAVGLGRAQRIDQNTKKINNYT